MERRPTVNDDAEDEKSVDSPRSRTPLEVFNDWWHDRQHMLEHAHDDEDDEEDDDSSESSKKRRIGKSLRGLFRKNVAKENIDTPHTIPEGTIIGSLVEVDKPAAEEEAAEAEELELPEVADASDVNEINPVLTEKEDDDEENIATTSAHHAQVNPPASPIVAARASSGSGNSNIPPLSPPVTGNVPAANMNADLNANSGNGNFVPTPNVIEREPVVENHYHRRAALAALVIAERIDHHRNEKRKEQINKVEKTQEIINKKGNERIARLEQKSSPEINTREQTFIPNAPRIEKADNSPRVSLPSANEAVPKITRPQSVKEVLEARQLKHERPVSLADLEHNQPKSEEHLEREDILVAAEKLAARASENISHEVYDERWHEIKDEDSADAFGSYHKSKGSSSQNIPSDQSHYAPMSGHMSQPSMVDPSKIAAKSVNNNSKTVSGLWVALVVGVIFAIMLIAL